MFRKATRVRRAGWGVGASRWAWLTSPCWRHHAERVKERDADGRLVLVCLACGDRHVVFADPPPDRRH